MGEVNRRVRSRVCGWMTGVVFPVNGCGHGLGQ